MSHLLVTNDFAPKVGGIQTYLWELWRRLPPQEFTVVTTPYPGAADWDARQPFAVQRVRERVLLPRRATVARVRRLAAETSSKLVVLDPALPLGLIGPELGVPYVVVLHGAEVTVPGRLPVVRSRLASVLRGAHGIIAAGGYPRLEAARALGGPSHLPEVVEVPPGVDHHRFHPLSPDERRAARVHLGLPETGRLVLTASRLVPRKGVDTLIEALPYLVPHHPDLVLAVAGTGRDVRRLRVIAGRLGVAKRVRFLGRLSDTDLVSAYGCADVFAMLCRNRWGGLEQEGFGIVFLEAAACGVPQVAGASGGAAEAVEDGVTGHVIDPPTDARAAAASIADLLDDEERRARMGAAARARVERSFTWDALAGQVHTALAGWAP